MDNNFKNPFELDEEDTIISLDPAPRANQSINNQQIGFNPTVITSPQSNLPTNPTNTSASSNGSMFDLLDPNIN
jgi:hypothetical protein